MENEIIDLDKFGDDIFDDFTKNTVVKKTSSRKKIPVVMLSGFLGSGKTTLLNHILRVSPDLKIGAIVNDFGKINIDNKLVSGSISEKTIELSNGCICCILGENGLREPLDILANQDSELDAILIEASGIAEPLDLLNNLRFSGNDFTRFGGNIYVVDSQNFELAQAQFPSHFAKCLRSADIILLNKTDLISAEKLVELTEKIRQLNRRAPIIPTTNAEMDPAILFAEQPLDQTKPHNHSCQHENNHQKCAHNHEAHSKCSHKNNSTCEKCSHHDEDCQHHRHCDHIHHHFTSVSFSSQQPLSPQAFIDFLDNLPENLFRMKGFCYFGMKGFEQKFTLQLVGKTIDISAGEWEQQSPKTELVLIGMNMDCQQIEKRLQSLIDPSPEEITPENMMNFERFLT